jgi:hypothetical protein
MHESQEQSESFCQRKLLTVQLKGFMNRLATAKIKSFITMRWRYRRIIALTFNTSLSRLIDAVTCLGNVAFKRVTM